MFSLALISSLLLAAPFVVAETHTVIVGGPNLLVYTPEYVQAAVGDVIRFEFRVKNHTATQSSFQTPCQELAGGFDSGFQPVPPDQTADFPYKEYPVTSTGPAWFYCQQGTHCSSAGMVFAVNPGVAPALNTFEAFKAAATGKAPPTGTTATSTPTGTSAGYPYPSGTTGGPAPTGTNQPKNYVVVVGGPGILAYNPSNITAKVGDTVTFQFKQKNHTVTQSSFANPCRKLEFTSSTIGFDSGFMPVADNATSFPEYKFTVNDTQPIWAYCRQTAGNHCGNGMVFAVNADPNSDKSFDAFQANAKRVNGTVAAAATEVKAGFAGLFGAALFASFLL